MSASDSNSIGVLYSGGVDSAVLVGHLLDQGRRVRPMYVRSHLHWEQAELAAARRFLAALAGPRLEGLVVFEQPLADLYGDHWSTTGREVPGAETPDEAVYLPGRNALLLVKPFLWCHMHGVPQLALAPLAVNPFPDATGEFFAQYQAAMNRATATGDSAGQVEIVRPFERLHKDAVLEMGRLFPLELTFSCIDPVAGRHCGRCNKCAERQAAFRMAGLPDQTIYAARAAPPSPDEAP